MQSLFHSQSGGLEISIGPDAAHWNESLARLGGHPLQSALWGDARRLADGVDDCRIMITQAGKPVWLLRFEKRKLPGLGVVALAPGGPAGPVDVTDTLSRIAPLLGRHRIMLLIADHGTERKTDPGKSRAPGNRWTAQFDIRSGRDTLWRNMDKTARRDIRAAQHKGMTIRATRRAEDTAAFHALCLDLSRRKNFNFQVSLELMQALLAKGPDPHAECELLVARAGEDLIAGVFLLRCGPSVRCLWAATNRNFPSLCGGEATQWAAIEWALERNSATYEIPGGNPHRKNPTSVYRFKKKLGARAVELRDKEYFPLNIKGKILAKVMARLLDRI